MPAKRLELHPAALSDLKSAISWYMQRSESAALNFASAVDQAIDLIAGSPSRWPTSEHNTRKLVFQRFP
jgi:plasmid stabilization system protein ParE